MEIFCFVQFLLGSFLFLGQDIQADANVRLIDGKTNREGFVQIMYNGSWSMLYTRFQTWTNDRIGFAICGMLNYSKTSRVDGPSSTAYTNVTRYPYLLQCKGWERNIGQCLQTSSSEYSDELLYVWCENLSKDDNETQLRLVGTGHNSSGIVEMRHGGVWRRLCYTYDNLAKYLDFGAANVMCKMIGFPRAVGPFIYQVDHYSFRKLNTSVGQYYHCNGTENNIAECPFFRENNCEGTYGDKSAFLGLFCQESETPPPIQFRLNGSQANNGFLEMRYLGAWGAVCSALKKSTKEIICRELGWLGYERESFGDTKSFASWELATSCDDPRNLTCSYIRPYKLGPCGRNYIQRYRPFKCKVATAPQFKVASGCLPQLTIDRTGLSEKEKHLISFYQVEINKLYDWYTLNISVNVASFPLGDQKMYGRVQNKPLKIGEKYEIKLRGVYKGKDGKLGFGVNSKLDFIPTGCPATKAPTTIAVSTHAHIGSESPSSKDRQTLSSGTIVLVCAVGILFIAVVALVVYACRTRERYDKSIPETEPLEA